MGDVQRDYVEQVSVPPRPLDDTAFRGLIHCGSVHSIDERTTGLLEASAKTMISFTTSTAESAAPIDSAESTYRPVPPAKRDHLGTCTSMGADFDRPLVAASCHR